MLQKLPLAGKEIESNLPARSDKSLNEKSQSGIEFKNLRNLAKENQSKAGIQRLNSSVGFKEISCRKKAYRNFKSFQKVVYMTLEDPNSYFPAKIFFIISIIAILYTSINSIISNSSFGPPSRANQILEEAVSILFVVEYGLRMLSATAFGEKFYKVMLKPFNLIDLIALVPFFAELGYIETPESITVLKTLRVIRLTKLIRVLKLGRYLKGVEVFFEGVQASISSFGFLLLLLILGDLVFATAYFYAENANLSEDQIEAPERVKTIMESMWWACVSIATVGYGDFLPVTIIGKVIACLAAVGGMLMLALPVAILGVNFQHTFSRRAEEDKIEKYRSMKFNEESRMDDSQKEIYFMNERINSIEEANRTIIKLLTDSESIYHGVAKDLRHLYRSIYADEKKEEEKQRLEEEAEEQNDPKEVRTPLLSSKLDMRIKLYEKLNKAKKKISAAKIFLKSPPIAGPGSSRFDFAMSTEKHDITSDKSIIEIEKDDLPELTLIKSFVTSKGANIPYMMKKTSKVWFAKNLETSDIQETDRDGQEALDIPVLEMSVNLGESNTYKKLYNLYRQQRDQEIIPIDNSFKDENEKGDRHFGIKCHSESGENDFLHYYLENLHFLSPTLLDELIDTEHNESSDSESQSEEEGEGGSSINLNSRNSCNALYPNPEHSHSNPQLFNGRRRRGSLDSKGQKFLLEAPKSVKIKPKGLEKKGPRKLDPKTWELTGKILADLEAKKQYGELEKLRKEVGSNSPTTRGKRKAFTQVKSESQKLKEFLKSEKKNVVEEWVNKYRMEKASHADLARELKSYNIKKSSSTKQKRGSQMSLLAEATDISNNKDSIDLPVIQEAEECDTETPHSKAGGGGFRSRIIQLFSGGAE